MFIIEDELKKLPDSPGVYMHKDALGTIIYVGKAISLKNRVRQYFQKSYQNDPKVRALVSNIAEFDYITCATEIEALILECNLIKKYMPKYNVLMKDDKTYPYIKITIKEEFPRVIKTRLLERDGNKYFGPYIDATAVNRIVDLINQMYPLKKCTTLKFSENHRPCLNYHINSCIGPCINMNCKKEYLAYIDEIIEFLNGKDKAIKDYLMGKLEIASAELKYEEAARYRDFINSVVSLSETQRVTMTADRDMDILLPLKTQNNTMIALFKVREGKLSGRETIDINDEIGSEYDELMVSFIKQYYTKYAFIPPEILLGREIAESELIEKLLSSYGRKITITVPKRGAKKALLEMVRNDSLHLINSVDDRIREKEEKKNKLRNELIKVIEKTGINSRIEKEELRIESYDISNTNGMDSVGAMVVYEGFKPIKNDYRKFKIKTVEGPDDYGSLQEVIYRRLKRALDNSEGFTKLPDLIMMDGGQGQVNAALSVIKALKLEIAVVGLAKDDKHRTRAIVFSNGEEIALKENPFLFKYAGRIQEEVHRFAITYHRGLRGKSIKKSILDDIEGVGPKRRNALLNELKSIENIKNASYEELIKVDGITAKVAESVNKYFAK